MKRFILGFIGTLSVLAVLVYICTTQSNTTDLLLKYRRQAPFSEHEMSYYYVGKPWFGKGIIFYHPQFSTLPLQQTSDRLKLSMTPIERSIYLSGVTLEIAKTLRERPNLLDDLKSFQEPYDFLLKPLEGLVLLDIDTFRGDILIELKNQKEKTIFTLTAFYRKNPAFIFKTEFPSMRDNRLWAWTDASFQTGEITIKEPFFLQKIATYYLSLGQPVPPHLKGAIARHEPFTASFTLKTPYKISSLLKGKI